MFVIAVLTFVLSWAVATTLVSLVSFGAAPLWLLLAGPLMVASWTTVAATRIAKPAQRRSERTLARVHRNGSPATDVLTFFLPFATLALLFVYALPIHSELESAVATATLLIALPASIRAARTIRLPVVEGS